MFKFSKSWIREFILLSLIFIITVSGVSIAQFHNGKLNMCNELEMYYTQDGKCLTCEQTGRVINSYGECVVNKIDNNADNMEKFFKYKNG